MRFPNNQLGNKIDMEVNGERELVGRVSEKGDVDGDQVLRNGGQEMDGREKGN